MKLEYLPFPIDDRTPEGYRFIVAYSDGKRIVAPITLEENDNHDCDANGCSSVAHVISFDIKERDENG